MNKFYHIANTRLFYENIFIYMYIYVLIYHKTTENT